MLQVVVCFMKSWRLMWRAIFTLCFLGVLSPYSASSTTDLQVALLGPNQWSLTDEKGQTAELKIGREQVDFAGFHVRTVSGLLHLRNLTEAARSVSIEKLAGFQLHLTNNAQVVLGLDPQKNMVVVTNPSTSASSVIGCKFNDGATAELQASSSGKLDLYRDGSYSFNVIGQAKATNADGQHLHLSPAHPPLLGGPLREVSEGQARRMERLTPATNLRILGREEDLQVEVNGRSIQLTNGVEVVEAPNGSRIKLDIGSLRWSVEKGEFRIGFAHTPGYKVFARTGQSGVLTWDAATKTVDLLNNSPDQILVGLPTQVFALANPNTTFQFTSINSLTFAAACVNGTVMLRNHLTQKEYNLAEKNLLFRSGTPDGMGKAGVVRNSVELNWAETGPMEVTGTMGAYSLPVGTNATLTSANKGVLEIAFSESKQVTLRAMAGNASCRLLSLPNMHIEIEEGNVLSLTLDMRRRSLVAQASSENSTPIKFDTAEKLILFLHPNDSVTLIGQKVDELALEEAGLVFYENAGSGEARSFSMSQLGPVFLKLPHLNIAPLPRVPEPHVSVKN